MATPAPITAPGHILQALSKLLTPFKAKPRFASWCAVPINQLQTLEDQCWSLLALLDVDAADLPRLVLLGKIVGQAQRGTLEQFRRYVKTRVLVNRSSGTAPEIIKIARILLAPISGGPPGEIKYTEYQPATIFIEAVDAVSGFDGAATAEFLNAARLGGVRLNLVASTHDDGLLWSTITEAIASRAIPDAVHGFSNTSLSDGGYTAQMR